MYEGSLVVDHRVCGALVGHFCIPPIQNIAYDGTECD